MNHETKKKYIKIEVNENVRYLAPRAKSGSKRTPILFYSGQAFRNIADTRSDLKRTLFSSSLSHHFIIKEDGQKTDVNERSSRTFTITF